MTTPEKTGRPILALAIATALGVGYIPVASGTWGSAAGLFLLPLTAISTTVAAITIVALFIAGSWSGTVAERHFAMTDPGPVVIDEVMGMLATMFMNPLTWPSVVAGFLLFRIFDIIKPYPANRLEHLPGGVGVMADDFMAAVYANLALRIVLVVGTRLLG